MKSTSVENPIFFVTCSQKNIPFNVFFSQSDMVNNRSMAEKKHIDSFLAKNLCENHAKANVTHPSTVDLSRFMGSSTYKAPNGRTRINTTFTAKNGFNLELKFKISCFFDEDSLIEANITEA